MTNSRTALIALLLHAACGRLMAQESPTPTEPTLPPVIVQPGDDNYLDDYSNQVLFGNGNVGAISWNAPASSFNQRVGSYNQPAWTT